MGADEDAAEPEHSGLGKREQHLPGLGVHPRQPSLAAHAGEAAALPLTVLQVLIHAPDALDHGPDFFRVRPEITLDGMIGEPLDRVPVFAPAPLAKNRRAPEFQNGLFLKARDQVRASHLDR